MIDVIYVIGVMDVMDAIGCHWVLFDGYGYGVVINVMDAIDVIDIRKTLHKTTKLPDRPARRPPHIYIYI